VDCRLAGNPEVDRPARDRQTDPAILRRPHFGDIMPDALDATVMAGQ
jgi:hypothetical protein